MVQLSRTSRIDAGYSRDIALACLLLAILSGCATSQPQPRSAPSSGPSTSTSTAGPTSSTTPQDDGRAQQPTPPPAVQPAPTPDASNATLALLQQSERAASNGSLTEAIAYAERAVRINPRQADLWTHLASLELQNQHPQTAIQYATKAVSLANGRPDWQRDAWLVIASAKENLGEHDEARDIRERWRSARG